MRLLISASVILPEDSSSRIFGELVMKRSIVKPAIPNIPILINLASAKSKFMTTFSS